MSGFDSRPVLLGHDMVSPLGTDLEAQWQQALAGKSGVGPLTRFQVDESFVSRAAGEVPEIDPAPFPFLSEREMAAWPSPIFRHGLLVVHRALERSGLELTPEIAPRVATTFSTAVGGVGVVLEADRRMAATGKLPKPSTNPNHCINMVAGKVSILSGATGPVLSGVNACATGNTSLILGAMLLVSGQADVAICGAVDFPLVPVVVAGFVAMNGAYRPKPEAPHDPPERCSRPFSENRRGFVVAEGAAAIILSTRAFAQAHGLGYEVELAGWGMTSDAHHYVTPHPPTVERCLREALAHAGVGVGDIQAVSAHAASTRAGDKVEADCLHAVFGDRVPPVTANKSLIGHAMGASSAIEAVLAVEGLRRGLLPPTINHRPAADIRLPSLVTSARRVEQEHVLNNAFGFGGCNACTVFRRVS